MRPTHPTPPHNLAPALGRSHDGRGPEAAELGIFNAALPADQLDAYVLDYARQLARVPKELLGLEKLAINKTQDIQGFREAIAVGFEIDVIGHLSPAVVDVNRRIREDGLRPTIEAWQAGEF